jgi:signal transduction histidine kinase/CheY-like chemotaxis protein
MACQLTIRERYYVQNPLSPRLEVDRMVATTESYRADVAQDIRALQLEALRAITIAGFVISALWTTVLTLSVPHDTIISWVFPAALALSSAKNLWLLERRPLAASFALPFDLVALAGIYMWLRPGPAAPFMTIPAILVAGVVVSRRWTLIVALVCVLVAGMTSWWQAGGWLSDTAIVALLLNGVALPLTLLSTHNLYTALEWATQCHTRAVESLIALRERQGELRRVGDVLQRNQERMHYLNLRLEQAKVAAEEAYRTKQHFVANVSHELRTPLNLITGFSEMMAFSPESYGGVALPPQYRDDVTEIYRSSRHLLGLVEDVLALAQLEAGHMIIKRDWASLRSVVEEAVDTMAPLIEAKGLALHCTTSAELPLVYMDSGRVRQILLNLLNNAYRYTTHGLIDLTVDYEVDHALITVRDSGIGISEADLPHIFEEFHNLSKGPNAARSSGFGLGLSISRRLVEAHGGRIWATSTLGEGSSFHVALPISIDQHEALRPSLVRTASRLEREISKPVLLVVCEDEEDLLARHLEDYDVVHARPEQALSACEQYLPTVLWVNDYAPATDSARYLAPIRRDYPTMPVIACRIPTLADQARRLWADDYLAKPITRERVMETIVRFDREQAIETILIVDDDPRLLNMLQRVLSSGEQRTYRVLAACGGQEGLDLLAQERPDLVLLDLAMPGISGYDLLDAIHKQYDRAGPRVVLMTGVELDEGERPVYQITVGSQSGFSTLAALKMIRALLGEVSPRIKRSQLLQQAH